MANPSTENLYLLEFLVNDVTIESGGRCDCGPSGGELCVSFQFLNNQELELCERDFSPDKTFSCETSRIGKSCIFSLTPQQAQAALQEFPLTVSVNRRVESGAEKSVVGTAAIAITGLLSDVLENSRNGDPVAKILEEKYPLINEQGTTRVGSIYVYIRLSCYGKMIITQFQMNMGDKTVLFKDKEGRSLYRYKKKKAAKTSKIEDLSDKCKNPECPEQIAIFKEEDNQKNQNCPSQPCYPNGFPSSSNGPPPCAYEPQPPAMGVGGNMYGGFGGGPFSGGAGQMFPPCVGGQYPPFPPFNVSQFPGPAGPVYGSGPGPVGPFNGQPMQDLDMFYSPTLAQQAAIFPTATYEQRVNQADPRSKSCLGPCSRR